MKRLSAIVVACLLLGSGAIVSTSAHAGGKNYYSSCSKLLKKYPNGVAKNRKAQKRAVRQGFDKPAAGKRARKVYKINHTRLDRDKDGVACEQS